MTKRVIAAFAGTFAVLLVAVFMSIALLNAEPSSTNQDEQVYKMTSVDVYPGKDKWPNNRQLTDEEAGVRVTYLNNTTTAPYSVRNANPVSVDGAHAKLKFHSDSKKFSVTINNGGTSYNDSASGLTFILNLADGALYLNIDGVSQDLSEYAGYDGTHKDRVFIASMKEVAEAVIKTTIADNGDFVFTVNDYDFVIAEDVWTTSEYLDIEKEGYYLIAPQGQVIDYTWNYLHGGDKLCFEEVEAELGAEATADVVEAITKIQQIPLPISLSCQDSIDAAKEVVEQVAEEHRKYIVNLSDYESAVKICQYINLSETALDTTIYPVEVADVGPKKASWPETTINWYAAQSGKGVTIEMHNATVHNECINYRRPVAFDKLHIQFDNHTSSGSGDVFALIFGRAGTDMLNANKPMSLEFYMYDDHIKVMLSAKGQNKIEVINSRLLARPSFANGWSIEFSKQDNGDYEVKLCDSITGIIPKDYIDAAVTAGLNLEEHYVTLGAYNTGGTNGELKVDIVSLHSGVKPCYDALAKELGADTTEKIVDAIVKIGNVKTPITVESGSEIMVARDAVEAVPEEYRNADYIYNLSDYETLSAMYNNMDQSIINLDPEIYPVEVTDVGPDNRWPGKVDYYKAESGKGVTIKFIEGITVQQLGLNVNKAASLDKLHLQFDNFDSTGAGNSFALIFSHATRADVTSNNKCMCLFFKVEESRIVVSLAVEGKPTISIIDTMLVGKANLQDLWSIEFKKLNSGDYEFKLLNAVKGIIPQEYINGAQDLGLNTNALYVTYSAYNLGNAQPTTSTIDVVSLHSGEDVCYCNVSEGDYLAAQKCKELIDAIGTVTENSGDAVDAANDAYNALDSRMRNLVTNADVLVRATRDYNNIATDVKNAAIVIDMINRLPSNPQDATYEQLIDCYGKYLDLYPRCRKRVTNVDKLMACVRAYETAHPGIELKLETVNEYTGGKNAHYITGDN